NHPPIKLVIDEPSPGSFVWTLLETDASGAPHKVVKAAEYGADTYEGALASGTRALDAALHKAEATRRDKVAN
ncbi:MAG: hypothetical protein KKC85_14375, partial [Gammaproteobacteria bacterium]|nr:hypothetical protein [Gammaproteobacteria bacterium]